MKAGMWMFLLAALLPVVCAAEDFADSPVFVLDAREAALAPYVEDVPYTAVSALEDGVPEAMRDLDGDGYPDAFQDRNGDGTPDAFEQRNAQGQYTGLLDVNDNTFPDWFETRYATPVAKFMITNLNLDTATVTVRNVSVSGAPGAAAITGYHWDFGDGATFDGFEPPAHIYTALDNYTLTLTLSWTGGDPVTWERQLLPGIRGSVVYVDAERGQDADGFGGGWLTPFRSLGYALNAAAATEGVTSVWARAGIYTGTGSEVVLLRPDIALYGGFAGGERSLDERDLAAGHNSVIDGENARRCVTGATAAVLDGFTLTNGAASDGAGLYCNATAPEIRNCLIRGNAASSRGGGVYCYGASAAPTFVNCVIANNSAAAEGGGIQVYQDASPEFVFCTIAHNTGSGVTNRNGLGKIYGSIVWGNTGGGVVNVLGSAPEVYYSIVQGGYSGFTGNLDADPLFWDVSGGDYRITAGSPALDAGWAPVIPEADAWGRPRPWGSGPDMGAFEYQGEDGGNTETLPLDTPAERSLTHGRSRVFVTPIGEEVTGDVVATLTPLPGAGTFRMQGGGGAQAAVSGDGWVLVTPRAQVIDGEVRHTVTALNWAQPTAANGFQLVITAAGRLLTALPEPITVSAAGPATLTLQGAGFIPGMRLEVRDAGGAALGIFTPTLVTGNTLQVTLDVTGIPAQMATLALVWPDEQALSLEGAVIIVTTGIGPRLETSIDVPAAMRPNRRYTVWFHYANTGDADLAAPLFTVTSDDAVMRLRPDAPWQEGRLQFLGLNSEAPVEVLPPGCRRSIPIYIETRGTVGQRIEFEYVQLEYNTGAVDWRAYSHLLRPADVSAADWSATWPQVEAYLGATWDGYFNALYDEAARLTALALPANGLTELLPPLARRAAGLPVARIQGRAVNSDTGEPIANTLIKAQSADDAFMHFAPTDGNGAFLFTNIEDAEFGFYIEGWQVDPPMSVVVSGQQDVVDVFIEAYVPQEDPPLPDIPTDQRAPIACVDDTGRLWLLWSQGSQTRWALWKKGAWTEKGMGPDTTMPVKALGYGGDVADGELGLYALWEHLDAEADRTQLNAALARINGDVLEWSETCTVSGTTHENVMPTAVWSGDGLLVLWLQFNPEMWDDPDLYYGTYDTSCFVYVSRVSELPSIAVNEPGKAETCTDIHLSQGTYISGVPIIGGNYKFEIRGSVCGEESCDGYSRTGSVYMDIELSKYLRGNGTGSSSANWGVQCKPTPSWVFQSASLSGSAGAAAQFEVPFPISLYGIPVGTIYAGGSLQGSVGGTLYFKNNFPSWPSYGEIDIGGGGSGTLRAALLDLRVPGEEPLLDDGIVGLSGSVGITFKGVWPPPASLRFTGYCVTLTGEVSFANGWLRRSISGNYGSSCGKYLYASLAPGSSKVIESGTSRTWVWMGKTDEPSEFSVTYEVATDPGTGNVHEGLPVLNTVADDLYGDGAPTLINDGITTLALWVKDFELPATQLGDRVATTLFDGSAWSAPDYIEDTVAFNGKPAAAFLPDGRALAVWSQADSTGLTGASSVEAILDAKAQTDLVYAIFDGTAWTTPAFLTNAQAPVSSPALAVDAAGYAATAWLQGTAEGHELWASLWDGAAWSTPALLGAAVSADAPVVASTANGFVVIWSKADYNEEIDGYVWRLNESWHSVDGWSALTPLPETLAKETGTVPSERSETGLSQVSVPSESAVVDETGLSQVSDNGLPEDCCEGEGEGEGECENPPCEGELPPPPCPPGKKCGGGGGGGGGIGSWDPNEKHSTSGLGNPETQRFIFAGDTIDYVLFFENTATALAPAQEVFVTDQLPAALDWSTFELTEIAWGDVVHPVETSDFTYTASVNVPDHRPGVEKTWRVDIEFTLDVVSGECFWALHTIDPETGELPEDVWAGFLPPNDPATGCGEGHISFSVKTKNDVPDGTRIENTASIVFDTNDPIVTNTVFNTVAQAPQAAFSATPTEGLAPLTVNFTNESVVTSGVLTAWSWDFGDGDTSDLENPSHTFADAGEYTVTLTVVTAVGEYSVSAVILVTGEHHPADTNTDWRMVMAEAIGYIYGWQLGSNPMDYAVRAAYLWQKGEYYTYDSGPEPPLCWVINAKASGRKHADDSGAVTGKATAGQVRLTPVPGTRAWGAEVYLPEGLMVIDIDGPNGAWDEINRKLSWWSTGDAPVSLGYRVTGMPGTYTVRGEANFDGTGMPLSGLDAVRIVETPEFGDQETEGEREVRPVTEAEEAPPAGSVVVPDLMNKNREEALAVLEGLGLVIRIQEENSKTAKDTVIRQQPASGTEVDAGAEVTLTISTGRSGSLLGCGPGATQGAGYLGDLLLLSALLFVLLWFRVTEKVRS